MRIKRGDTVLIRTGDDKGRTGKVLFVDLEKSRVVVEDMNKKHRHQKPTQKNQQGGIVAIEAPIHVSNVALFVSEDGKNKPIRIGHKVLNDGGKKSKVRISRLTGEEV